MTYSQASDTFTRADQSGLGTASDSETWAKLGGSTPTLAIASNEGTWTGVTASATYALGTNTITDAEVAMRVKISTSGDSPGVVLRCDGTAANLYRAFFSGTTFTLGKVVAGSSTSLVNVTGQTFSTGTFYWIKLRVIGTNLYAKFWTSGNSEPDAWNASTTDSAISAAGRYGIRISLNGTGDTVSFDSFTVNKAMSLNTENEVKFYTAMIGLKTETVAKFSTALALKTETVAKFSTAMAALKTESIAKFFTRTALKTESIAKFYTAMISLKSESIAKFYTRMSLKSETVVKFFTRMSLNTETIAKFYIRTALKSIARTRFIIANRLTTVTRLVFRIGKHRALSIVLSSLVQHIVSVLALPVEHISATFIEVAMTTPYTTIDSSATVKDQNGSVIANLSVCSLTVVFPDFTTSSPTVNNMGSGVYTATYATKGLGGITETWNFTDVSGAIAQEQRTFFIVY